VKSPAGAGADINQVEANDITPLVTAITNNHPDVATYPDRAGRRREEGRTGTAGRRSYARSKRATWTRTTGRRSRTASRGPPFLPLIQLLLDKGADPNARTAEQLPIRNQFLRSPARWNGWTSPA
jgi:hypothetical protein